MLSSTNFANFTKKTANFTILLFVLRLNDIIRQRLFPAVFRKEATYDWTR